MPQENIYKSHCTNCNNEWETADSHKILECPKCHNEEIITTQIL